MCYKPGQSGHLLSDAVVQAERPTAQAERKRQEAAAVEASTEASVYRPWEDKELKDMEKMVSREMSGGVGPGAVDWMGVARKLGTGRKGSAVKTKWQRLPK